MSSAIDYSLILSRKYSAEWNLRGNDYDGLEWLSEDPQPSQEELDALWPIVVKEIENEKTAKAKAKKEILEKLGLSEEEMALLLA